MTEKDEKTGQKHGKKEIISFTLTPEICAKLRTFENRSAIVEKSLASYLHYYELQDRELNLNGSENYCFIAKTRWGKTTLVKSLLKARENNTPILVVDPHSEYNEGETLNQEYYERIPLIGEEMYRLVKSTMWNRVDSTLKQIEEQEHTILRLNFTDIEAEKIFVSELLRALLQKHIHTKEKRLLVLEEAQRYTDGLIPTVSQGLKNGLQTIAISQFPLPNEVMLNSTPILGYQWRSLLEQTPLPLEILETLVFLKRYEFVFYDTKEEQWCKFKLHLN